MASENQTGLDPADIARIERVVMASPILAPIIRQWAEVSLPDGWLVAGAIAQAVWNDTFGFRTDYGVADVDLVYFNGSDLSEDAEEAHASRIRRMFSDRGVKLDVKNEARVHLWYREKFGYEIAPYLSTRQAITTFPTTAGAIGIQPGQSGMAVSAPFGLADLFGAIVRPNKVQITRAIYEAKVMRWRALWPQLKIVDW